MDVMKWRIRKTRRGRWGVWPPKRATGNRPIFAADTHPQAVRALAEIQRRQSQ